MEIGNDASDNGAEGEKEEGDEEGRVVILMIEIMVG